MDQHSAVSNMELFPTEFSEPTVQEGDIDHSLDHGLDTNHSHATPLPESLSHATPDAHLDNTLEGNDSETPLRGKAATHGLTQEEKKERQKQQNRRAAERSRNKKREELTALEMTVNNIQDENNRLRARLASLLAAKPSDSTPFNEPEAPAPTGIDYATIGKLQSELATAKETLLQRELELANAQSTESDEKDAVRAELLASSSSLTSVQAEVKSLHALVNHLRAERDSLSRQRDSLSRELEARRALRDAVGDVPGGNGRSAAVERALLDLRGMVDGVIKTWEQSTVLPARPMDGNEGAAPE